MAECVVEKQGFFFEEVADGGDVGGVAADVGDAVLGSEKVSEGFFKLLVDGPFARDDAAGGDGGAVLGDRTL